MGSWPGSVLSVAPRLSQIRRRRIDFEQAAVFLHHINSSSAVACVDHQAHRAARLQDVAKGAKTEVRVGQVMQHSCADHQVERATNLADALDRELMQFEILQIVLALKIARVAQARVADVDRRDFEHRAREARTSRPATCRSQRPGFLGLPAVARRATSDEIRLGDDPGFL